MAWLLATVSLTLVLFILGGWVVWLAREGLEEGAVAEHNGVGGESSQSLLPSLPLDGWAHGFFREPVSLRGALVERRWRHVVRELRRQSYRVHEVRIH